MTKSDYLQALKETIRDYPIEDQAEILQSFESHIDESLEKGKSMDEIVQDLGEIEDIFLDQSVPLKQSSNTPVFSNWMEKIKPWMNGNIRLDFQDKSINKPLDTSLFQSIVIQADCLDIELDSGEEASYRYTQEGIFNSSKEEPYFNLEYRNDQLIIVSKYTGASLELTLPKTLKSIEIQTSSGDIEVQDLDFDSLLLKSKSGDIEISDCSGNLQVDLLAGDLDITDCEGQFLSVTNKAGDISLEGNYPNGIIHCIAGDVDLELERIQDWYVQTITGDINISCANQDYHIEHQGSFGDMDLANRQGSGRLSVKSTMGDVEVH